LVALFSPRTEVGVLDIRSEGPIVKKILPSAGGSGSGPVPGPSTGHPPDLAHGPRAKVRGDHGRGRWVPQRVPARGSLMCSGTVAPLRCGMREASGLGGAGTEKNYLRPSVPSDPGSRYSAVWHANIAVYGPPSLSASVLGLFSWTDGRQPRVRPVSSRDGAHIRGDNSCAYALLFPRDSARVRDF
jgi:hypothetical protein